MQFQKKEHNRGFALLLAMIVASVVLSIGIAILNVSVNQLKLSSTARESEIAFQSSQAIMDCLYYWRNENATEFTQAQTGSAGSAFTPPSIGCFGTAPREGEGEILQTNDADRRNNSFSYVFEWGEPLRCSEVELIVMSALSEDLVYDFPGTSVGADGDGQIVCESGTVCNIIFSQGYNRPCAELSTSIFTVQRELTLEF